MKKILYWHKLISQFYASTTVWGGTMLNLAIRLYVGWHFFKAGMIKISDWSVTLDLFRNEYHVPVLSPELAAVMGTSGELIFPILLAIGVFSRPAALGLFIVNAMAVISYPDLFTFECPAGLQNHFYWGALLLVLMTFGSGHLSLDHWLSSKLAKA